MSALNLRLPDSLHDQVRELAERDNISMNQFIAIAVAEKISALMTLEYLAERANRGSREKFERVLNKISESPSPPLDVDQLPDEYTLDLS